MGLKPNEATQNILEELNELIGVRKPTRGKNNSQKESDYFWDDRYFSEKNMLFFSQNYTSAFLGRPERSFDQVSHARKGLEEFEGDFVGFDHNELGQNGEGGQMSRQTQRTGFQVNYQQRIKELFAGLDVFPGDRDKLMEYLELQDKIGLDSKETKKNVKTHCKWPNASFLFQMGFSMLHDE